MIRVLIADDHPLVLEGLIEVMSANPDMVVVGHVTSGAALLDQVSRTTPDVVIMDLSMPGPPATGLIRDLVREHRKVKVVTLSFHSELEYGPRMLKAGAAGYVMKGADTAELLRAIRKVASGGRYVSPALGEQLAERYGTMNKDAPPHERLTDREYEIFRRVVVGQSVREVAEELALSLKTVSTYRARIFQKMGMRRNAELVRYAVQHRLI